MAARTSPKRCWRASTSRSGWLLLMLALAAAGCGRSGGRLLPVYVNPAAVLPLHPGYAAVRQLDELTRVTREQVQALASQGSHPLPPTAAAVPAAPRQELPAPPVEPALHTARQTAAADMQRLEQELRRGLEEKLARRQAQVEAATRRAIAVERARLDEQLWQEKLAIVQPQNQRLTSLQLEVNNLRRLLDKGAILPGQLTTVQGRLRAAEAELRGLQGSLDRQVAELESRYAAQLATYANRARAQAAAQVDSYRQEQSRELERLLAEGRQRLEQGLASIRASAEKVSAVAAGPAPVVDLARLRSQVAAARRLANRDRSQGLTALRAELRKLQQERSTLVAALTRDTEQAVQAVMEQQGLRVSFGGLAGHLVRNSTDQAKQAMRQFWGTPGLPAAGNTNTARPGAAGRQER